MLYSLLNWLEKMYQPPGFGAFSYISVRSAMAALFALLISLFIGMEVLLAQLEVVHRQYLRHQLKVYVLIITTDK